MASDIMQVRQLYEALRERLARLESGDREAKPPEKQPEPERTVRAGTMDEMVPPPLPVVSEPVSKPEVLRSLIPPTSQEGESSSSTLVETKEDRWSHLEKVLGLKWTTWIGGLILFLGASLFVKYSFDQAWLGPWTQVGLGLLAGCAVLIAGEIGLRRNMVWLGQGLVGIGLAILYTAAFGAYAFYELLPHSYVFVLMLMVTAMGMGQAIRHNALSMAFLSVLGGFLTPILLRSGENARDALFAYMLLLDMGVLAVAWFKRWRALDILAFAGTMLLFMGWFHEYEQAACMDWVPTVLWLVAFFVVFLVVPFLYHLRHATPVTGERFLLAVTNAMGLFGGLYVVLHGDHRGLLSMMTLGMSLTYLAMGFVIHQRIKEDAKTPLGCAALFVTLLTVAIPIALDLHGVTIAWAAEGPLLLFLAYLYPYKPVRVGSVLPWCLAAVRLFTFHWPMHSQAFTLFINPAFGTAMFVVLAGGVSAGFWRLYAKDDHERLIKEITGLTIAFLGLFMVHSELWSWLGFERHAAMQCWLTAMVWTAGAVGFAWICSVVRKPIWYWAGVAALGLSAMLCVWAYGSGSRAVTQLLINGRFLASLLAVGVLAAYGILSRFPNFGERVKPEALAERLYILCALAAVCLCHGELFFWLKSQQLNNTIPSWALPWVWVLGGIATAVLGQRFNLKDLRSVTLLFAAVASALVVWSYAERIYHPGWLYFNVRFFTALASVTLFMSFGFVLRRFEDMEIPEMAKEAFGTFVCATILLFVWLNVETYLFTVKSVHVAQQARWAAHMAISLVWGVYASGLLSFGFARRVRLARFSALALFGVTALKLVFVDLAGVEEVYRIISFVVLGLLIIAASYLYHHAEKQFTAHR